MSVINDNRVHFSCPHCLNEIKVDQSARGKAGTCNKCHNRITVPSGSPVMTKGDFREGAVRVRFDNPGVWPAALSILLPGLGQMVYRNEVGKGACWLLATVVGYAACIIPGIFLHGLCVIDAERKNGLF